MVHAFMYMCAHVQAHSPMYGLSEPGGLSSSVTLSSPSFLKPKVLSSLNLELSISATLGAELLGSVSLHWGCRHVHPANAQVLGFQIQVLQLPSPSAATVANKW